jgi:hypothetical protein
MKNTRFSLALFSLSWSLALLGLLHAATAQAEISGQTTYSKPGQPSPPGVPGKAERMADAKAQSEQRRVALRAALLADRKKTDEATRVAMRDYHLSAQELAAMRQQLGQQLRHARIEGERVKP